MSAGKDPFLLGTRHAGNHGYLGRVRTPLAGSRPGRLGAWRRARWGVVAGWRADTQGIAGAPRSESEVNG